MKRVLSVFCAVLILLMLFTSVVAAAESGVYDPAGETPEGKRVRVILLASVASISAVLIIFVVIKNLRESR